MQRIFFTAIICLVLCNCQAQNNSSIKKSISMKEFILLVQVPVSYSNETAKSVGPQWDIVLAKWKEEGRFVTSYVFPGESYIVSGADRNTSPGPGLTNNLKQVSCIILRAENLIDAVKEAKLCPVLDHDGAIEVREVPPRPVPASK
jgi:hypothetical protein